MRVALYVPPIPDENRTPPLGPLYLLAVLEQHGFEGRLFDARIDRSAFSRLLDFKPEVVGVSAVTAGYLGGLSAAQKLKEFLPGIPVVFGGPHPSSLPREVVAESPVDYVLIGEGEQTLLNLLLRLRDRETSPASLREVRNLVFKTGSKIISTDRLPYLSQENLDALPWPAFHRMDLDAYFTGTQAHGLFKQGKRVLPLMSTRGCPFACTFCCRMMGKIIRSRSVEAVMGEVSFLVKTYGIDELYFEDDNFTVQRDRALEILARLAAHKPPLYLKFANGIRADLVDKEILTAMKKARVYSLSFGIESGCEATLNKMKKQLDLHKARENVLLAKSMGFLMGSNCIIGYPGETASDIEESLQFFFNLPLDSMAIVNLVPFPGTEARAICEKNGWLTQEASDWDRYFFSLNNPHVLIDTPLLPREEVIRLIHQAYRRMYLRPRFFLTALKHLSWGQCVKGAGVLLGFGRERLKREDSTEKSDR